MVVTGTGIGAGIAGALILGRGIAALLYETSPSDPRVLALTAILLLVVTLASAWLPAWRASRVEPKVAMREE
jgi:ABC-type antimicrobial peptide transport system permease subunit